MLQRLICKLGVTGGSLRYIPGYALQGILMGQIDADFASELHTQGLNPYSQHLNISRDGVYWIIHTLTSEAGQKIIEPLASSGFTGFHLDCLNKDISISEKSRIQIPLKDLVSRYYFERSERIFRIHFITPTAFKSGGEYVFHPDLRLFIGSLMRKHSFICENNGEEDTETLEYLVENTKIMRYNLESMYNRIASVRLPAFSGYIIIKSSGPQQLVNYLHFLLRFGEYSGVGIKCAIGMGAIEIIDKPND